MGNLFSINSHLWNAANQLLHFLWLSILWTICCIPLITIGASTTALYSVCLKYAKNEEGYLTSSFFRAMKQNFKQATVIWVMLTLFGCFLGLDLIIYSRQEHMGMLSLLLMIIFLSVFVAFLMANSFVYALQAKFDNTVRRTILNSFLMAARHWPSSLAMMLISFGILMLGFLALPPILFLSPALISYINSRFLIRIFEKYL